MSVSVYVCVCVCLCLSVSVSVYVCVALFVASVMRLECLYESLCLVIFCICVSVFYISEHLLSKDAYFVCRRCYCICLCCDSAFDVFVLYVVCFHECLCYASLHLISVSERMISLKDPNIKID